MLRRFDLPAFVALAFTAAAVHLHLKRGLMLYYDEYAWAMRFRHVGSGVLTLWGGWFDPLARLVFNGLFATAGLRDFGPYRALGVACNLTLAVSVFAYARSIGRRWLGLGASALLLFLGSASSVILYTLNSMNALGMAALPVGLLLLQRRRPRFDALATATLLAAMGFAGPVVLPVCLGLAVWIALDRPFRPHRLLVPVLPVASYVAATALLPGDGHVPVSLLANALNAPVYVADLAAAGAAGIFGVRPDKGAAILVALAFAAVRSVPRLPDPARRRTVAAIATLVASWGFIALARAQFGDTTAPRYVVLTAVPVLIVAIELIGSGLTWTRGVVVAGVLAFAVVGNILFLRAAASTVRERDGLAHAELGALELALDRAADDYRPDPRRASPLWYVSAGEWRRAIHRLGSPAPQPSDLPGASADGRVEADRILTELGGVEVVPALPSTMRACSPADTRTLEATVGAPGRVVAASGAGSVEVRLRRFADGFPEQAFVTLQPGEARGLVPVPDRSPVGWIVQVNGEGGASCPLPGGG